MRHTMRLAHSRPVLRPPVFMLDVALDYARRGWRVFPLYATTPAGTCACKDTTCHRGGEHPCIPEGSNGATSDQEIIRLWWQQEITAQVGIATGNGLLVIEIDPLRGASLEKFVNFYALADAMLIQTGKGGWQFYFSYNPAFALRSTRDKLGPGVSTHCDGDFVIAPPTRDRNGMPFRWLDDWQPAQLPAVLLPLLLASTPPRGVWPTRRRSSLCSLTQTLL